MSKLKSIEYAQIEPTTRCNFKCGYCYESHLLKKDLSYELYLKIIDKLPGLKHIELQGDGEPLLNPDFIKMAAYARAKNIKVSLITNGSMLKKYAAEIVESGMWHITISIDSADQKLFKKLRGGDLNKIIEGIKAIIKIRNTKGFMNPYLSFSIMLYKSTFNELPKIVNLYHNLCMDGGISIHELSIRPTFYNNYSEEIKKIILSEKELIEYKNMHYNTVKEVYDSLSEEQLKHFYSDLFRNCEKYGLICPWLRKGIYINSEGEALPCCSVKDSIKYCFGRFHADPVKIILKKRKEFAKQLKKNIIPECCNECKFIKMIKTRY